MNSFVEKDLGSTSPQDGRLFLNNQRVFVTSTAAMSLLRKDLIEMVGLKRTRQFLVLHGWSLGVHDATLIMQNNPHMSKEEMALVGPKMHVRKGHVNVDGTYHIKIDRKKNSFYMEGKWKNSYEAEEHKKLFGFDDRPTCFKTIGYASGYLSTIFGFKVIVKEIKCEGKGDDYCHWVAKPEKDWQEDSIIELFTFNDISIIKELEIAYEKIKEERDHLNKSFTMHKRLTRELIQGNGLPSIANVLFETLDVPIMFEDHQFNVMASSGLTEEEVKNYNEEMKCYQHKQKKQFKEIQLEFHNDFKPAVLQVGKNHFRLMIPILSNHKITGYCSIIRQSNEFSLLENMMIERSSVVCAMYLLNERTAIEAERRMRENILGEILTGKLSKSEIMKLGHYVNTDFLQPYHIVVVNILNVENMKEELNWKDTISHKMAEYSKSISTSILITNQSDNFVLYIPKRILEQRNKLIREMTDEILSFCSKIYSKVTFCGGISTGQENIEQAKIQYEEALTAVKLSTKTKPITSYEELGFIGLLVQTGDKEAIKKYAFHELKDLLEYDKRKGMDLTKTLYNYIINGGNLEQTSCSCTLSISGLRYRIEKIKDILAVDIRQPVSSYPLFLAIQMLIILGELQFDLQ